MMTPDMMVTPCMVPKLEKEMNDINETRLSTYSQPSPNKWYLVALFGQLAFNNSNRRCIFTVRHTVWMI